MKDPEFPQSKWTLSEPRRSADKSLLSEFAYGSTSSGQHRVGRRLPVRRTVVIGAVAGITLAGGVTAAAVFLQPQNPTVRDQARCYSAISKDFSESFAGASITILRANGGGVADAPDQVIEACAAGWRQGTLGQAAVGPGIPRPTGPLPVPALVACVLPDGEAAVFPGGSNTCTDLGLAPMAPQGASSTSASSTSLP